MKLKREYRIGTRVFKMKAMDKDWRDDAGLRGQIKYAERLIQLHMGDPEPMKVLMHEVIHALEAEHGPDSPIPEWLVWVLGDHIVQFCIDNGVDLREGLTV